MFNRRLSIESRLPLLIWWPKPITYTVSAAVFSDIESHKASGTAGALALSSDAPSAPVTRNKKKRATCKLRPSNSGLSTSTFAPRHLCTHKTSDLEGAFASRQATTVPFDSPPARHAPVHCGWHRYTKHRNCRRTLNKVQHTAFNKNFSRPRPCRPCEPSQAKQGHRTRTDRAFTHIKKGSWKRI